MSEMNNELIGFEGTVYKIGKRVGFYRLDGGLRDA